MGALVHKQSDAVAQMARPRSDRCGGQPLPLSTISAGGAVGGGLGILLSRVLATRVRLARSAFAVLIVIVAVYVGWKAASALGWTG